MARKKLTAKQEAFVREYPKDFNGTQAAIRAGYSPNNADSQAQQILAVPAVATKVEAEIVSYRETVKVDVQWVVDRLVKIADDDLSTEPAKLRALEMLARYLGMFKDKLDLPTKTYHAQIVQYLEKKKKDV